MKKTKSTVAFLMLLLVLVNSISAFAASDIPIHLDFSSTNLVNSFTCRTFDKTGTVYGAVENGRYTVHYGGTGDSTTGRAEVSKSFDTPISTGVIAIDYNFKYEEGRFQFINQLPGVFDSAGNKVALLRMVASGDNYTYALNHGVPNNRFRNVQWTAGQEYDVRLLCDLDNKTYRFYQAKAGETLVLKETYGGLTDIPMGIDHIASIQFYFEASSTAVLSKCSFGEFHVYRFEGDDVFVSPTYGSDSNDGSYKAPFATYERALQTGSEHIYLMDGTYTFNSDYTYGSLNYNSSNVSPLRPMPGSTIKISGDYQLSFPELNEMNVKDEFKEDVLDRISDDIYYVSSFTDEKVLIDEVTVVKSDTGNTVTSTVQIRNPNVGDERFMFITAIYNSDGSIYRTVLQNSEIKKNSSGTISITIELPEDYNSSIHSLRTFLWNGDTLSPYITPATLNETTAE